MYFLLSGVALGAGGRDVLLQAEIALGLDMLQPALSIRRFQLNHPTHIRSKVCRASEHVWADSRRQLPAST